MNNIIIYMLPNEIIYEIYKYSISKFNLIKLFPWLKDTIPKCSCDKQANFIIRFNYNDSCRSCKNRNRFSNYEYLCSLKCKNLYYDINCGEYIIEPSINNNYKIKAELLCVVYLKKMIVIAVVVGLCIW